MKLTFTHNRLQSSHTPLPGNGPRVGSGTLYQPADSAELAQTLQASLDVEKVLETFSRSTQWACPHDGFSYDHPAHGVHLSRGRLSRHSASYNLTVDREEIGELRFTRGRKFRENELFELERLMGMLIYPLRNSLLYHQAVTAAQTDRLTGLQNRTALEQCLPRELATLRRDQQALAVLVVDVDHFKRINDTLGHSAGDRALQATAECLKQATRESDMLFRFGGEEFVVVLRGASIDDARRAGERIRAALRACEGVREAVAGLTLTASIGATCAVKTDSVSSLFDRADRAMYTAKQCGRDRVEIALPE